MSIPQKSRVRLLPILVPLTILALTLSSCQNPDAQVTSEEGTSSLRIAVGAEPGTVDPVQLTSFTGGNIVLETVQTLTSTTGSDGKPQPLLAESWSSSPDQRTFSFKLRKGVRFTDGSDFNAAAVKANFDRLIDPAVTVPYRSRFSVLKSVDVVNDSEVQFNLGEPYGSFPGLVSHYIAGILSPASFTAEGNTYKNIVKPVGTGPYEIDSYAKGQQIVQKRNTGYWGAAPAYDSIDWIFVPEAASRLAQIRSGSVDIAVAPPSTSVQELRTDSTYQVISESGSNTIYAGINQKGTDAALLSDVRVRRALNLAINREGIVKTVLGGLADIATGPVSPTLLHACKIDPYAHDPEEAKRLLAEAGAQNLTIDMIAPTGRYNQDFQAATAIAGDLRAVGVKVNGPTTQEWSSYIKTILAGPANAAFNIGMLGAAPPFPEGGETLRGMTTSSLSPAGLNFAGWSNKDFDAAISNAWAAPTEQERTESFCTAQTIMWDQAPWLFLWNEQNYLVASNRLDNIKLSANAMVLVDGIKPKK